MQVLTKAIVISSVKYRDTSLIVKCYTQEEGVKAYLLRGILKSKKGKVNKAHFLPLSILSINALHNNKGALNSISEAKALVPLITLHTDFVKQSVVFFISEVLAIVLREEEGENSELYLFLEQAIQLLDLNDEIANFHIKFLIELTRCLGFYPDEQNKEAYPFFDLFQGKYTQHNSSYVLQGDDLALFKKALGIKFEGLSNVFFSKKQRGIVVGQLLKYYQLHLPYFRQPKSLEVLSKVLE
ncbi:DNA repair protein RecO [Ochrovirga pacifica]|uniref:DNA repair protein RecO n=1 Tax=Ochrovirga pacifica TaxID=1042376 RepID=UPI0002559212|nr:DNA repair protein RecO [Ochrovirga pacifica]